MAPRMGGKPPSRQGTMQVAAFLWPNQIQAAYDRAAKEDKTNTEICADAINAVLIVNGLPPVIVAAHDHIVRRRKGKATIRSQDSGPGCRAGRRFYGGWLEEGIVRTVNAFASSRKRTVQSVIEEGVHLMTGVAPEPSPEAPQASQ